MTEVAAASGLPPADWEEQPNADTADRCAWYIPVEMFTLNVEVYTAGIFDIAEQADREGLEAREVPDLDGALAVYDTEGGTTFQIWAPLPDGTVMLLMQVQLQFDEGSMNDLAVAAYQNLTGETVTG